MGDRANVVIRDQGADVWLYTHWGGTKLPATVRDALARKQRWQDGAYLARIVFCEMIQGDTKGETGFGISTGPCDNEHDIIVVNVDKQRVEVFKYDYKRDEKYADIIKKDKPDEVYSFDEFVAGAKTKEEREVTV